MDILTPETLHEMVLRHLNELVIDHSMSVKRLVGYVDGEDDYYYILKNAYGSIQSYTYTSAVMPLYFIKETTSVELYKQIDSSAIYSGLTCVDEIMVDFEQ